MGEPLAPSGCTACPRGKCWPPVRGRPPFASHLRSHQRQCAAAIVVDLSCPTPSYHVYRGIFFTSCHIVERTLIEFDRKAACGGLAEVWNARRWFLECAKRSWPSDNVDVLSIVSVARLRVEDKFAGLVREWPRLSVVQDG